MKIKCRNLLFTLGMLIPMMCFFLSCSDNKDDVKPDKPDVDEKGNEFIVTDNVTPLRYTDLKYIGGDNGVSIEVTEHEANSIKFVCKPGADIQAYRVNVYPVSSLYNTLLNQLNVETELEKYTTDQVNDLIYMMISNTESEVSGGKLMNASALGADYASNEFDCNELLVLSSGEQAYTIKPDADYLIVVQAYFDKEGTENPADLCLCHVLTPDKELVGNPTVDMDVEVGFYSYSVKHILNEDCRGYYYLGTTAAEIQQYIDTYGEEMYKDLLCHYGGLVEKSSGNLYYSSNDLPGGDVEYCTTAIAVDVNGTPSKTLARKDFKLAEVPENTEEATGTVSVPEKVSASVCHFKVKLDKNCSRLSYNVYPAGTANGIMQMSEEERKEIALAMVTGNGTATNPGWIVQNPNYKLDKESGALTGTEYESTEFGSELADDSEYKIVYACMNGYGEATDLKVTESFRTKKLVKDRPSECIADIEMSVPETTREGLTIKSTFDKETVARVYWQYYSPVTEGTGWVFPKKEDASDEARYADKTGWLYWFLEWRDPSYGFPWPNELANELVGPGKGQDEFYWGGFQPGTTYCFAYIAEDWNGVLGPVKFFDCTTKSINGGDNPSVQITYEKNNNGSYEITYTCNDDTRELKYCVVDLNSGANLGLKELLSADFGGLTYDEYIEAWTGYCMQNGLSTNELKATQDMNTTSDIAVALALPVGGATEGNPVYGELKTLVYRKSTGTLVTLEEYMGVGK